LGQSYNPAYVFGFPKRIDRMTASVAIIMGSESDWDTMRHADETLAAGALVFFFFMGIFCAGTSLRRLFSQEHLPVFTKTG